MVKRMVCESYGVNWESLIESTTYVMRLYGYREAKEDEGDNGLGRHLDTSMITILHQNMAGLQVENKHGQWVTPHASPNLFCVVAGQAFMVGPIYLTVFGMFRLSLAHRATLNLIF